MRVCEHGSQHCAKYGDKMSGEEEIDHSPSEGKRRGSGAPCRAVVVVAAISGRD